MRFSVVLGSVLVVLVTAAGCGGEEAADGASPEAQFLDRGRAVYRQQCITCHQPEGEGISGVYPTLHRTQWTTGDKGRLIRLVLDGMEGPIEIKGASYDQRMRPLNYLSDEEIAAVLTFVRQNFGNDASKVTPAEVAAVRAAGDKEGLWSPDALWKKTGIPAENTE